MQGRDVLGTRTSEVVSLDSVDNFVLAVPT